MTKRNRRDYTDEFKLEAIRLVEETDKTMAQVSRDLGIGNNLIGRWKKEFADRKIEAGRVDDKDAEIRRLKAELRDLREDHDIVKKAAAYFARNKRRGMRLSMSNPAVTVLSDCVGSWACRLAGTMIGEIESPVSMQSVTRSLPT